MPITAASRPPVHLRRARVAGLLVTTAALAAFGSQWLAPASAPTDPSSSTAVAPRHGVASERPSSPPREAEGASTGRPGLGEADGAIPGGTTVFDSEVPGVAKVSADLLGALRRAAADGANDGVQLNVDSGWRSPEYQQRLLDEAIVEYGSKMEATRWVATPGTSAHVRGDAVDVGPSGAATWLSEHGAAYGLCQTYANEPWHFELRSEAVRAGCPALYADPTQDPRSRQR